MSLIKDYYIPKKDIVKYSIYRKHGLPKFDSNFTKLIRDSQLLMSQ